MSFDSQADHVSKLPRQQADIKWWSKNKEIIQFLDEGRSIEETAFLVGRSPKTIQSVRKRLHALRTATPTITSLDSILSILATTPHVPFERPPEILEAFESFLRAIEEEAVVGDETDAIHTASSSLDDFIYP